MGLDRVPRNLETPTVMKVLLGITGGIAAYKAPDLLRRLQKSGCQVGVAMSPSAERFVSSLALRTLADHVVMEDIFAVESENIGHIDLADWADVMAIAPATAQTLARLSLGMADEPVSLSYLATTAPTVVFPAMNVNMWRARPTRRNVETLRGDGVTVVDPGSGELACGWKGAGRLPDLDEIVDAVWAVGQQPKDLAGRRILITAGPTREPLDPVRFLSNPSSGRMGFALARAARRRGADVVLVAGPSELTTPWGVERVDVETAVEMRDAVFATCREQVPDILMGTAAVSDYRPAQPAAQKHKKGAGAPDLDLERNPDVLQETITEFRPTVGIGFAAETEHVLEHARNKLEAKSLSLIVANDVGTESGGFGDERNRVWIINREGEAQEVPLDDKLAVAHRILDSTLPLLGS